MKRPSIPLNQKTALAIVFVSLVFVIGYTSLPIVLQAINDFTALSGQNLNIRFTNTRNKIESAYQNMLDFKSHRLINRGSYINLNGLMARIMGQRIMNSVVKLNNGYLTTLNASADMSMPGLLPGLTNLKDFCDGNGIKLVYVQAPYKVNKYDPELPLGTTDYTNKRIDNLLSLFRSIEIDTIDLREEIRQDEINYYDAFFKVDLHWKPETAFWANRKILEYLTEHKIIGEIPPKHTNIKNYKIELYKKWWLGSEGKRVGSYYAGVDDISVIYPDFDTNIRMEVPERNYDKTGPYYDVIIQYVPRGYYTQHPYDGFYNWNNILTKFSNEEAPVKKKLLIVSDSFNIPMRGFTALNFETLYAFNIAGYSNAYKEYFKDPVTEYHPDIVVIMLSELNFGFLYSLAAAFE
ncbi:MAG: hypothetical protein LBK62_04475 [Treponema sp.]|nr:hypothetical protein [Treponema sp.]